MPEKRFKEQVRKGGVKVVKNPGPDAAGSRKVEKPKTPLKSKPESGGKQ